MLYSINDPISKFIEYINKYHDTGEAICILLVDPDDPILRSDDGDKYYGLYMRSTTEPHLILLADNLDAASYVEVLVHEYTHHLLFDESRVDEPEDKLHDDAFFETVERVKSGFFRYLSQLVDDLGCVEFV